MLRVGGRRIWSREVVQFCVLSFIHERDMSNVIALIWHFTRRYSRHGTAESLRGVYPLSGCIFYLFIDLEDVLPMLRCKGGAIVLAGLEANLSSLSLPPPYQPEKYEAPTKAGYPRRSRRADRGSQKEQFRFGYVKPRSPNWIDEEMCVCSMPFAEARWSL